MNLRQLRKQDKRAAALLIAATEWAEPEQFGDGWDGRWSLWQHCGGMEDEWDEMPALNAWEDHRYNTHPNMCAWMGFHEESGDPVPKEQRPRAMRPHEARRWYGLQAPAGYRWRGRRVVPVDKHGAMVRAKKGQTP